MIRKTILLIILLVLPISIIAQSEQSKFNVEGFTSAILIKSDGGLAFGGGLGYEASNRIHLNLGYLYGTINSDLIDDDYNINKYYVHVDYRFNSEESKSGIAAIMGFSYMDFDDTLNLDDGTGFGCDLGANAFISEEKWEYGTKLIATYNSKSPGAILEIGVYLKYKF